MNSPLKLGSQHPGSAKLADLLRWLANRKMACTSLAMFALAVGGQPKAFLGRLVSLKLVTWHSKFTRKLGNFGSPGVYRPSASPPRANSAFWQELLNRSSVFHPFGVQRRLSRSFCRWPTASRPFGYWVEIGGQGEHLAAPKEKSGPDFFKSDPLSIIESNLSKK